MSYEPPAQANAAAIQAPARNVRTVRVGFTLVELLVVFVVIAVLFAMLLPALGKARDQASLIQCTSNLRPLGILTIAYTLEYRGWYPITGNYSTSSSSMTGGAAVQAADGQRSMRDMTQRARDMRVFGCPTQHDGFSPGQTYANRVRNYNINSTSGFGFGYAKHVGTYSGTDCTKPINGNPRYQKTFENEPWRAGDPAWMTNYRIGYRSERDVDRSRRSPSTIVMWMDMNRLDTTFTTRTAHAPLAWGVSWATATKFAFVTGGNEMTIDGSVMWTASSSKFWTYTYDGQAGAYYYSGP